MQHNTQAIEATSRQAALDGDVKYLVQAINHPENALAWTKPELTDEEAVQLIMSTILYFRNRENDFAQYQRGVMDEATWQRYNSSLTAVLGYERGRNFWVNYGTRIFDPKFGAMINDILEKSPVMPGQVQDRYRAILGSPDEYKKLIESSFKR